MFLSPLFELAVTFNLHNKWFQKISIPTQTRDIGNSKWEGSQKPNFLRKVRTKYKLSTGFGGKGWGGIMSREVKK